MYTKNSLRLGFLLALALVFGVWAIDGMAADSPGKGEKKGSKPKVAAAVAKDTASKATDSVRTPAAAEHRVIAYYFHGNARCPSCLKIEAYTKEAIDSAFGEALKSGLLEWRVVNTDSSQNEHFLTDYQLFTKSVVVSDINDGKETQWKNLDKVWELLGDKDKFHSYIQSEVRPFLELKR
jgi:hypothetical protein